MHLHRAWLAVMLVQALCLAQTVEEAARELAKRVAAAGASAPVLRVSGAPAEVVQAVRAAFESELHPKVNGGSEVQVTVSANVSETVLAAEWKHGEERSVFLTSATRSANAAPISRAAVVIQPARVWQQDSPILDFVLLPNDRMLLLDEANLALYTRDASGWQVLKATPIVPARPWPRDLRGRLEITGDAVRVLLPGMSCRGVIEPALPLNCEASDDPATLAAGRNYFSGATQYFSMAAPDVYALTDGRARMGQRYSDAVGSDMARVPSRCGTVILASKPGSGPDSVQPFFLNGSSLTPAGAPADFPGPVTALWPAGTGANAVVRDPQGSYAAYTLSLACGG